MFEDDSFPDIEDLFSQLRRSRQYSQNTRTQTQSLLNTVETKKETFLIFDLSGKTIISVEIKDDIEMDEYGERVYSGQKVLTIELEGNEVLRYNIPKIFSKRKMDYTFSNGILEVSIKK
ncbi:MAG: hypothetical protein V1888_02295 [archaeon]